MDTRNESVRAQRESLLTILIERLLHRGYQDLRVCGQERYEGLRPDFIFWDETDIGFMPDASAVKGGIPYIFQVETKESLRGEEAQRRIALFSAYARHYRRQFVIVTPEEAEDEAREILMRSGGDERFVRVVAF